MEKKIYTNHGWIVKKISIFPKDMSKSVGTYLKSVFLACQQRLPAPLRMYTWSNKDLLVAGLVTLSRETFMPIGSCNLLHPHIRRQGPS